MIGNRSPGKKKKEPFSADQSAHVSWRNDDAVRSQFVRLSEISPEVINTYEFGDRPTDKQTEFSMLQQTNSLLQKILGFRA
jgi:hypothetical protein